MINDLEWSVSSLYKSVTKNKIKINANKCQLLLNIPTKVKILIGKKEIEGSDNKKMLTTYVSRWNDVLMAVSMSFQSEIHAVCL